MNSTTLRRLAADQASLHNAPLPPHYLFGSSSSMPDDLTQLTILLAGPQSTPYAQGLWKLHLKIPEDYPKNPPKAAFKTRIWHPNVDDVSGSVCVDTLKRDWDTKLTLRDVLITISCLLIHPNPDSALNSSAAALLQEDYSAFSRQAALMTSIHARIPPDLLHGVLTARQRGEDPSTTTTTTHPTPPLRPALPRSKPASTSSVTMKKPTPLHLTHPSPRSISAPIPLHPPPEEDSEPENDENAENDPSLSPSPVTFPTLSPRRPTLAKRPLSDLPTPTEPDSGDEEGLSPSERNIAANAAFPLTRGEAEPETMKLAERRQDVNFVSPGRNNSWQQEVALAGCGGAEGAVYEEEEERPKKRICSAEGKENAGGMDVVRTGSVGTERGSGGVAVRKVSTVGEKAKGRAGLRRL